MRRAQIATSSSSDNIDAINAIRRKLRDAKVKVATIIHRCEQRDRNSDGLVHIDDLEDIFNEVVDSEYRITRRELMKFVTSIVGENKNNGSIMYEKIADILEPAKKREVSIEEHWQEDGIDQGDTAWATQTGTTICSMPDTTLTLSSQF